MAFHISNHDFLLRSFTVLAEIQSLIHGRPPHSLLPPRLSAALPAPPAGSALPGPNASPAAGEPGARGCTATAPTPPGKVTPAASRRPSPSGCGGPAGREGGGEAGRRAGMRADGDGMRADRVRMPAGSGQRSGALAAPASGYCSFKAAS